MEKISQNQVKWVRSLQQKKHRDAEGVFVAEGRKCIEELLGHFEMVLRATTDADGEGLVCTEVQMEQMSSMRTPQGEIAVFRRESEDAQKTDENLVIALDGVQDPGNLGTIIRTADWYGIHTILCSPDTADCWNPKVVQATMGALGRTHIVYGELEPMLQAAREQGTPIYGTLLDGKNLYNPEAIPDRRHGIIVMGNEGNGISEAVRRQITHSLYIPATEGEHVESLNVAIATAIVVAEFKRI